MLLTTAVMLFGVVLLAGEAWSQSTLVVGVQGEIVQLDPHLARSKASRLVRDQIYESLLRVNDKLGIESVLAERFTFTSPTRLVLTLRKGVKFHDGTDLTSTDVAFSIIRLQDRNSAHANRLSSISAVSTPDPHTIVVSFAEPKDAGLTPLLSVYVVSQQWMKNQNAMSLDSASRLKAGMGTGPFKWQAWAQRVQLILERNPNWWGQRPFIDVIRILEIPQAEPLAASLKSGQVDVAIGLPETMLAALPGAQARHTADWGAMAIGPRYVASGGEVVLHQLRQRR